MRTGLLTTMSAALSASRHGAFILFEGIDRCGKSTQSAHLAATLPNAELIRFPNRETVSLPTALVEVNNQSYGCFYRLSGRLSAVTSDLHQN